jgi:hypothetical protein
MRATAPPRSPAVLLAALLAAGGLAAGCGSGTPAPAPPGTPANPLHARTTAISATTGRSNESRAAGRRRARPGYGKLVERQESDPRQRFTPCNLVTRAQAGRIVGGRMRQPVEAPQGPTCIYRSRGGASFVSLAVQPLDFARLRRLLHQRRRIAVSGRAGVCGEYGQPMLYVSLARGRVLSVAGPCAVARRFAVTAVRHLKG